MLRASTTGSIRSPNVFVTSRSHATFVVVCALFNDRGESGSPTTHEPGAQAVRDIA